MRADQSKCAGDDDWVIRVTNVGKSYMLFDKPLSRLLHILTSGRMGMARERWVLHDISLTVKKGVSLAIIGENGCGKSTLLQMIAGILQPSTGGVHVRGKVAALLELGAGFNPDFSGRENVRLVGGLYGLSDEEITRRFPSIEAFAEIGEYIDMPVKTYSSGMFVRLAFAVISHVDADILLIDEALAVGDVFFTQKCMRYLRRFMESGTVIFVSHDMGSVRALADEAIWIRDGVVAEYGDPKTVGDAYLRSHYARTQVVDGVRAQQSVKQASGKAREVRHDFRLDRMRADGLENEIRIFDADGEGDQFGAGNVEIFETVLRDEDGTDLLSVAGGERVELSVRARALEEIASPIFGFFVRNRLGQNVFGDNTYYACFDGPSVFSKGSLLEGRFEFVMPFLPRGDYSVCVAVATGSNEAHVQQHWINEALVLKSVSSSVHADLFGMPMISMRVEELDSGTE